MRPPESWSAARVTLGLAALTALAWVVQWALDWSNLAWWGGFIPDRVNGQMSGLTQAAPVWLTPLTATLIHAGFIHLLFNLIVLLFCGRSVENVLGPQALAILYVVGAYAAAAGQYALGLEGDVPMVGASGAISAVLGAYAMLFGRNRVRVGNHQLALWLNALWLAVAWIVLQLLSSFSFESIGARLAIGAHIGGFLVGLLLARPLLLYRYRGA